MAHEVRVRPYDAPRDEGKVLALWCRTWQAAYPKIDFKDRLDKWFRTYWRTRLVSKTTIMVASICAKIVGFFTIDPVTGHIDQIAVAPEMWGKGVGEKLVAEAKRLSPGHIYLEVSLDNDRATHFYEKHGFVHARFILNSSGRLVRRMKWRK